MPLAPCRACQEEISTEANPCPHCGAKNPVKERAMKVGTLAGCLIIMVSIFAIAYLAKARSATPAAPVVQLQLTPEPVGPTERFGIWEKAFLNNESYRNPFDYREIELVAVFTGPSAQQLTVRGFYDGDGNGGQAGNVWKLRFSPNEQGPWSYTYRWTGTGTKPAGGSGTLTCADSGRYRGPLKVATDRSWFFEDARGAAFDARGYSLQAVAFKAPTKRLERDKGWVKNVIQEKLLDRDYNLALVTGPYDRLNRLDYWDDTWWVSGQTRRFDISVWRAWEEIIDLLHANNVYAISFSTIAQGSLYAIADQKVLMRYFVARFGAYYNWFGWSITHEWHEVYTEAQINELMSFFADNDPYRRLQACHDVGIAGAAWVDFTMRQYPQIAVTQANRTYGAGSGKLIPEAHRDLPIFGSEDHWEQGMTRYGQPQTPAEVRRGMWGNMLAGVLPIYSEWHRYAPDADDIGNMPGEPEARRLFDFVYTHCRYREWSDKTSLLSAGDRAAGITGEEYIAFATDGDDITIDLTEAAGHSFSVRWFNATTGATQLGTPVTGGAVRTLANPYGRVDSVVLLF